MAQQSIVNVDSRVEQSVVDSTTDVDASKNISSATSGGNTEENLTRTIKRGLDTAKAAEEGNGNGGNMSESNQKTIEESRTQTPGVGGELVDSDIDIGSGAGSPTKGIVTEGTAKPTLRASIKKPQSFKAVSINKHFLEKSSTGTTNTPAKVVFGSERTSSLSPQVTPSNPTNLSFAKPRLVAKSAPGVRDSSPGGLGASVSGGAKNAVEAQRAVWNKNQPTPTIPTKEMTDEELKKNFGIHLASRIQSEDVGKESTWADEDDDDDWIPETIEWNDGTKVALQVEPTTPTPITAYPVTSPTVETAVSTTRTMEDGSKQSESKTIENESKQSEPKAIEKESRQSEPKTLVFTKDPNRGIDKSDKGIKDAPPPRTSPWASLPPPNAVSLSNPRTESRASDSGGLQHSTGSREVHADDFNRWRDRPLNNQLYNSHTGQMEPVQDQRRGLRAELQLNKTQVLQRPPSQMSGHAEPSPAFQQSRAGPYRQDEYRRRRTSSNVSGGSGSIGRRLSFNKGMHSLEHSINSDEHAISSQYVTSGLPAHSDTQSPQTLYGPLTPTTATSGSNDAAAAPLEDPIAMQARIMRETRELARKRRLEEEAKEEAAKKERLRVKLEALEKEAAEKAAKAAAAAAAEAEKTAVLTANLPLEVAHGLAPSSVVTSIEEAAKVSLNDQTDNPEPNHSNNVFSHNNTNVNTDNAAFNSEKQTSSQPDHFKVTAPNPSQGQTQSLASIPYRPGSFGNRSPVKKFSSIQPSAQSSLSSTNTYSMPIRDPRYDTQDPSGARYANHNRFPYNESARWYDGSSPRASPYGSIGDRSTRALSATENQNGASASSNTTVSGTPTADPAAPNPHLNPPHPTPPHSNPPHLHPPHLNPRHMNPPHSNPPHLRSEIPPSSLATHTPQPEVQRVVPNTTVQSEAPVNKAATYHTKTQTHQTTGRVGRNSASPPSSATAKFNPWASYPEQLQRQEREELRLAREEVKQNLGAPMPSVDFDYQEVWIQRDPNDPEKILGRHVRGPHSTDTPTQQSSQYLQNVDVPSINQVTQIRPPSSPPPAEFCPVIALDISSDEDSQHGRQPKKFIPHVRLPPQPMGFVDSRPTSSLDNLNKPEIAKPDVTRYDRVLGNIMKTIEVSKGQQQSTPSTITPAKFSETKPVYTDERESQQQSSTTVSLPSRVEETRTQIEPEDICTNDEEEFLQRLYVQEFGSQPTVKIPVVYGTYIPQRPLISKAKKTPRPRGFAESVLPFEVVTEEDLLNEQGYPFIPIRLGPDLETKKVVVMKGWSKPLPREPRKPSNYNKNNNRKSGNNNGYYKKESKPFLNQRQQRMQSPGRPKPPHVQGWERQQHPVV